jgi:excisionase family DNA binding protein
MAGEHETKGREEVRLLNVREAARFLGTTERAVYAKVWKRQIVFVKIGRSLRFDLRDLEQLIETGEVRPKEFPINPYQIGGG